MTRFQKFTLGTSLAALGFWIWFDAFITILERTAAL
jgi:hypothetical protein